MAIVFASKNTRFFTRHPPTIIPTESYQARQVKPKKYDNHEKRAGGAVDFMRIYLQAKYVDVGRQFDLSPKTMKNRLLGRTKPWKLAHESTKVRGEDD